MTTVDLYKVHLKHREAYLLFLAKGESDTTLLPDPLTDAEQVLYNYCVAAAVGWWAVPKLILGSIISS